jgi:hypothetical protein
MDQFRIRPDGFKEIRKELLKKSIPISLIAAFAGLAISYLSSPDDKIALIALAGSVPIALGALAVGAYLGLNRQKKLFESYVLTFNATHITREQHNTPTVSIAYQDIREISKGKNGSISIKGKESVDVIGIPSQIEDFDKVETLLGNLKVFSLKSTEPLLQKYSTLVTVGVIALMAAVYLSTDKVVVGLCGTLLLAGVAYSIFEVQRSKSIDTKTKRQMWVLLLAVGSIIMIMYSKLTA